MLILCDSILVMPYLFHLISCKIIFGAGDSSISQSLYLGDNLATDSNAKHLLYPLSLLRYVWVICIFKKFLKTSIHKYLKTISPDLLLSNIRWPRDPFFWCNPAWKLRDRGDKNGALFDKLESGAERPLQPHFLLTQGSPWGFSMELPVLQNKVWKPVFSIFPFISSFSNLYSLHPRQPQIACSLCLGLLSTLHVTWRRSIKAKDKCTESNCIWLIALQNKDTNTQELNEWKTYISQDERLN